MPKRQNPSVTSSRMISPVCLLVEWIYWCRQSWISCAVFGEVELSSGRMLLWLHDVIMHVFLGFM